MRIWSQIANAVPVNLDQEYKWDRADNFIAMLKKWRTELPTNLQLESLDTSRRTFRAEVHLHQNYYQAIVVLCRVPLMMAVRRYPQQALSDLNTGNKRVTSLAHLCYGAAKEMLLLFKILLNNQALANWSWVDFQGCSVATLAVLLYGILKRDEDYSTILDHGMQCLSFMALHRRAATAALHFIKRFQYIADQATTRERGLDTGIDDEVSQHAEYESWLSSRLLDDEVLQSDETIHPPSSSSNSVSLGSTSGQGAYTDSYMQPLFMWTGMPDWFDSAMWAEPGRSNTFTPSNIEAFNLGTMAGDKFGDPVIE